MKKIVSVIALLISCQVLAQEYSTDYEIQYQVKYSLDSLNLDRKTEETLYLFASSDTGVFLNYNDANEEKIEAEIERQMSSGHIDMTGLMKSTNFGIQFYKNRSENKVDVIYEILSDNYAYKEEDVPLEWVITDDTKEYLDYQVQKATTSFAGRDYVAWFTLEIPINDGPYVFYGLPGLIVDLYDTNKHYHFSLIGIERLEEPKVWKLPKGTKIKKQKLAGIKEKAKKRSPLDGILGGISVNESIVTSVIIMDESGKEISESEMRRAAKKREDRKNNPIELE